MLQVNLARGQHCHRHFTGGTLHRQPTQESELQSEMSSYCKALQVSPAPFWRHFLSQPLSVHRKQWNDLFFLCERSSGSARPFLLPRLLFLRPTISIPVPRSVLTQPSPLFAHNFFITPPHLVSFLLCSYLSSTITIKVSNFSHTQMSKSSLHWRPPSQEVSLVPT